MIPGLTFDEAAHVYRFNGVVVPGVTGILKPLIDFTGVPPAVLEAASAFGTAVHKACELWDLDELDEDQLDAALVPYLAGWKKFSSEHSVEWTGNEQRVYHPSMRYAGTLDRKGMVDGCMSYVDIKSSVGLYPSVGPQLAAYKAADAGPPHSKRYAVQLKADGEYVLKEYTDPSDWPLFCSLITLRNWCAKNSVTPNYQTK